MSRRLLAGACSLIVVAGLPAGVAGARGHSGDRNHDGIPDRWERAHHLSLRVNQARRDQDHDGLDNAQEFRLGTDPRRADTDGDGVGDGQEVRMGTNPRHHDQGEDAAGTVQSFTADSGSPSTGTLTIAMADGSTVSGRVTDGTELRCEGPAPTATTGKDGGDGGSGDQSGRDGGREDGGATAAEPGEDQPGQAETGGEDQAGEAQSSEDDGASCTTADLTPGTTVRDARLLMTGSGAVFREVELSR